MPRTDQEDISKDILSGIAITIFIFTVSVYIPVIGFFSALLIPLPTLFYRSKLGRKIGAIIPVLTIILMVIFLGGVSIDILFFFELLLIGFVLSELFELDLSIERTVLYTCSSVQLTGILCLLFYSMISNTGIITLISDYVAKNLGLSLALYENMGVSEENIRMISASLDNIRYVLIRITPAIAIASTFFIAWGCLLLVKPMFKSKDLFYPAFGSLKLWKAPEYLVWGVIGSGILLVLPHKLLKIIGLNVLLILLTIYFFQGIAIVSFYFEKKQFPRILRVFLYSLIALQQVILLVVIGFGFFDIWLNFRKLETENHN
ncbi:MAG: YybS family protein [Proteobacteria bacterium]|nr:YybS family protein [Pseudomonadota bacterium]